MTKKQIMRSLKTIMTKRATSRQITKKSEENYVKVNKPQKETTAVSDNYVETAPLAKPPTAVGDQLLDDVAGKYPAVNKPESFWANLMHKLKTDRRYQIGLGVGAPGALLGLYMLNQRRKNKKRKGDVDDTEKQAGHTKSAWPFSKLRGLFSSSPAWEDGKTLVPRMTLRELSDGGPLRPTGRRIVDTINENLDKAFFSPPPHSPPSSSDHDIFSSGLAIMAQGRTGETPLANNPKKWMEYPDTLKDYFTALRDIGD